MTFDLLRFTLYILFNNFSKPIANRCSPRIKWVIGAATGGGTSTYQEFNATKELNSELDTNTTQPANATEIDNRDFKKENDFKLKTGPFITLFIIVCKGYQGHY